MSDQGEDLKSLSVTVMNLVARISKLEKQQSKLLNSDHELLNVDHNNEHNGAIIKRLQTLCHDQSSSIVTLQASNAELTHFIEGQNTELMHLREQCAILTRDMHIRQGMIKDSDEVIRIKQIMIAELHTAIDVQECALATLQAALSKALSFLQ